MALELPQAGTPDPAVYERADAARNRERILRVAADLVACRGIDHVTMQEIAREAQVGTGTVYRRFGDRAGLALALLEADETAFQEQLLRGDPPLGPGAPPVERLKAFGVGYLEYLEGHAELIAAANTSATPIERGPGPFYVMHLTVLLREALPELDAEHAARLLWAGLRADQFILQRHRLGWPRERLQRGWERFVDALCASAVVPA